MVIDYLKKRIRLEDELPVKEQDKNKKRERPRPPNMIAKKNNKNMFA